MPHFQASETSQALQVPEIIQVYKTELLLLIITKILFLEAANSLWRLSISSEQLGFSTATTSSTTDVSRGTGGVEERSFTNCMSPYFQP